MAYRIDVVSDSVSEAVRHAGGLMFDRRRAGWSVVVVTDEVVHSRALDILGVRVESPDDADSRLHAPERENRTVLSAMGGVTAGRESGPLRGQRRQLLLWGQVDDASTGDLHQVRHALSPAAQMFKAQALFSAGVATSVEPYEHFWTEDTVDAGRFFDLALVEGRPVVGR